MSKARAQAVVGWGLALAVSVAVPAQEMELTLTDGSVVTGELLEVLGRGPEANLRLGPDSRTVALARVVAIHGAGPIPPDASVVRLVGGDELRGELRGGDDIGENFVVWSRSLGELQIPVDRLDVVVFPGATGVPNRRHFRLPEDSPADEALFRKARRGFDTITGAIHRFGPTGVLFEWSEAGEPQTFAYDSLSAICVRGGVPREGRASAQLVTGAGDVVGVDLAGMREGELLFQLEGERVVSVKPGGISALTFLGDDRRFLSDLEPLRVEERGTPFEEADTPLYTFRPDRAAAGGFLVVGRRAHGKGVGTHARCVLTYRVPDGFSGFHARVGIDDGVLGSGVRGQAEVSIKLGSRVLWGPQAVRSGEPAHNPGLLAVEPGELLTLEVDFGDAWFLGDRVDWLTPVFLR